MFSHKPLGLVLCFHMQITLTPETQQLVERMLKEGRYRNLDVLIQAGVAMLTEPLPAELDEETLDAIDEAEDQIERGEVYAWDDVKKRMDERLAAKRAPL